MSEYIEPRLDPIGTVRTREGRTAVKVEMDGGGGHVWVGIVNGEGRWFHHADVRGWAVVPPVSSPEGGDTPTPTSQLADFMQPFVPTPSDLPVAPRLGAGDSEVEHKAECPLALCAYSFVGTPDEIGQQLIGHLMLCHPADSGQRTTVLSPTPTDTPAESTWTAEEALGLLSERLLTQRDKVRHRARGGSPAGIGSRVGGLEEAARMARSLAEDGPPAGSVVPTDSTTDAEWGVMWPNSTWVDDVGEQEARRQAAIHVKSGAILVSRPGDELPWVPVVSSSDGEVATP